MNSPDEHQPKIEPKTNIPLYFGEGPERILVGLADVDENGLVTMKIDRPFMPVFFDLSPASLTPLKERLIKPLYEYGTEELRERFWENPGLPKIRPIEGISTEEETENDH